MFQILFNLGLSFDEQCVGALKTPAPVPGKTLKYVQILTRHGARSPLNAFNMPMHFRGYWQCDSDDALAPRMHAAPVSHFRRFKQVLDQRLVEYLPNCRSGDLLLSGMEQHRALGQLYHKYIYDDNKLFSDEELPPSPDTIYARCTDIERTFRSAQSLLHGLFPPQSPNEILEIVTDTSDFSRLRFNFAFCPEVYQLYQDWEATDEFKNWTDTVWPQIQNVTDFLKLEKTGDNVNTACDWVATQYCSDKQAPNVVTPEIQRVCLRAISDYAYNLYIQNHWVPGSYTMQELLRIPTAFAKNETKVKFGLFSAHDTTIMVIKTLIEGPNAKVDRIPGYASHLAMELWEDNETKELYIRCALNGEDLNLQAVGEGVKIAKFLSLIHI